uniref:Uncharacterized protein n=1 Tax=Oryza punctata TaxID=4537 RepID=A0A0E0ME22_ORYPU
MTTTATATGDWRVAGRRPPACLRDIGLRRRRLTWCRSGGAVSSSICVCCCSIPCSMFMWLQIRHMLESFSMDSGSERSLVRLNPISLKLVTFPDSLAMTALVASSPKAILIFEMASSTASAITLVLQNRIMNHGDSILYVLAVTFIFLISPLEKTSRQEIIRGSYMSGNPPGIRTRAVVQEESWYAKA